MTDESAPRDTGDSGTPKPSAAAWREWNGHVESVLRGIAHALNNRAAALSALLELARDDDSPGSTESILAAELERVRELSLSVRAIGPPPPKAAPEAFATRDAATDAVAALTLHAGLRDRVPVIDASGAAVVRAPRWMYVRALVALSAAAGTGEPALHVRVTIADEDGWVVTRVAGVHDALARRSPYAAELVRAMGGQPLDASLGFRIPSLAALRRGADPASGGDAGGR